MIHSLSLSAVLFALWLLLSGHYHDPVLLTLGVASCVLVAFVTTRMDVVDREGHPIHLTWRAVPYWSWLLVEIVKANIDVAKRVLAAKPDISPTLVRVKASQKSDLGKVIYANSITLTPGTISIDVTGDEILVHAIAREGAESLIDGEMDRRVTRMAGEDR